MNILEGITLGQSKIGLLAYADDIAIIRDNIEIVKIHCKKIMDAASKVGLIINYEKTEYIKKKKKKKKKYTQKRFLQYNAFNKNQRKLSQRPSLMHR